MPAKGYKTPAIPEDLYENIKNFIEEHPELGYRSVNEFIVSAVREKYEDLIRLMSIREAAKKEINKRK